MTKKQWRKPEVKRIEAGSAAGAGSKGINEKSASKS